MQQLIFQRKNFCAWLLFLGIGLVPTLLHSQVKIEPTSYTLVGKADERASDLSVGLKLIADKPDPNRAVTGNINGCGNIGFNPEAVLACEATGSFVVNYTGFTPEAQTAFQYAVDLWSRVLDLEVPITIDANFQALAPGVLGSANAESVFIFNTSIGQIAFPEALSDQLVGSDLDGVDIETRFSSTFPFYFGLDGCPGPGEFDFVTVVMHEIGHGLGFFSSDFVFEANEFPFVFGPGHPAGACVGFSNGATNVPYIYDLFLQSASFGGTPYDAFADPSTTAFPGSFGTAFGCYGGLNEYYTRDDLTFVGPNAVDCNGGPVPIYAPATYNPGSSISHWDEDSFPGVDENSLETPFITPGTAVHDPGCALDALQDMGYFINDQREGVLNISSCLAEDASSIPTLSQWGLLIFGLLVLNLSVLTIRRREMI